MTQCPKCTTQTVTWSPAERGTVTAEPCGHRLSMAEARLAFPEIAAEALKEEK